jgi:hypothetical protein
MNGHWNGSSGLQAPNALRDDGLKGLIDIHNHGLLIVLQGFKRGKLTVEQSDRHKMPGPCSHPRLDHRSCAAEMKIDHWAACCRCYSVSVETFQRRAANYYRAIGITQSLSDKIKPGSPIIVVKWCAGRHFGNVFRRVQIIAVRINGTQLCCHFRADRGFSTARDAHDNYPHYSDAVMPPST